MGFINSVTSVLAPWSDRPAVSREHVRFTQATPAYLPPPRGIVNSAEGGAITNVDRGTGQIVRGDQADEAQIAGRVKRLAGRSLFVSSISKEIDVFDADSGQSPANLADLNRRRRRGSARPHDVQSQPDRSTIRRAVTARMAARPPCGCPRGRVFVSTVAPRSWPSRLGWSAPSSGPPSTYRRWRRRNTRAVCGVGPFSRPARWFFRRIPSARCPVR